VVSYSISREDRKCRRVKSSRVEVGINWQPRTLSVGNRAFRDEQLHFFHVHQPTHYDLNMYTHRTRAHQEDSTTTTCQISIPLRHTHSKVFTKSQASEESNKYVAHSPLLVERYHLDYPPSLHIFLQIHLEQNHLPIFIKSYHFSSEAAHFLHLVMNPR
jgi:hypothetical protein